MKPKPSIRALFLICMILAAAIPLGWSSAHAGNLGIPGITQVQYNLGESGADFVTNFQDTSGNNRQMTGGAGVDYAVGTSSWTGAGIPSGSVASLMIEGGKAKWGMGNATGISADYQVMIFLSSSNTWGGDPNPTGTQTIFAMDGIAFTRQGLTYSGVVNGATVGSLTTTEWSGTGLLFQKIDNVFSFWTSGDGGSTWTQQGPDVPASGLGANWASIHLFVKPGGGENYTGYADAFTVRSVIRDLQGSFAASDQALANSNWAGVRAALNWLVDDTRQPAEWRSSAHLRVARSYLAEGNYSAAANAFAAIAAKAEYPQHQRDEAAECQVEANRQAQGLAGRDPETSRVRVPSAPTPGRTLHVSPTGSDSNPGSSSQPFATLGAALAANRLAGPVAGGAEIQLADGIYPITSTIDLTNADSGMSGAPLTIRAANPGKAVLSGGKRLTGFQTVTDPALLARLPAEAQGKVMQCNLTALGISDLGAIQDWNWSKPLGTTVGLYVNGVPQTLARWPNTGLVPISALVDGGDITTGRPQTISYSNDRPSRWAAAQDVWLAGYFSGPTYDGSVRIGSINTAAKTITTAWCYTAISGWPDIGGNATYYAFNLLEEIDQPGEWYLDRTSGMLYWYPTADPGTSKIDLSMLSQPMMEAGNVNHLRLEGLVFESSRSGGVKFNNSNDCIMAGCTVRNMSGVGVNINGGQRNWLIGCDLHGLDQLACSVTGGDRVNLTRGDHVVANCRFRDFGRISRTTSAGCNLAGVGNKITHCLFQDCPAGVIGYTGNDHIVEYNDFRDCLTETDDCGVISSWGNPTFQGNIFRFNHFTHTGGGNTVGGVENRYFGQAPIRFDDAISGQTVYGNIFDHNTTGGLFGAVQVNCGRDNIIDNNLVIDCPRVYSGYYGAGNERYWWYNSPYSEPPYSVTPLYVERYPKLANLYDGNGQNFIWRTASVRTTEGVQSYGNDGTWMGWSFLGNTTTSSDPGFLDGDEVKNTMDPVAFWKLGMRPIPVDEIGLYDDATRAGWIDQPTKSYWNGTSGNWDHASVLWSGSAGAASSAAWNGNGYTTAVFSGAGGTVTTTAPVVVDGLAFTANGYTIAGSNPVSLNGPASEIDVGGFGAAISAPLAGVGGISVAGSGTLTLSGSNIYTGATRIRSGTLALSGGNNRLPTGTVVTLGDGGTANSGILRLNGCSQQLGGLLAYGSGSNNRVINGSPTAATLTVNVENGRNRFSGHLGGGSPNDNDFSLVKTGQGTLHLDKSIACTGGTTVTEGTLQLNSGFYQNNHASGLFNIDQGATLAVSGGIDSYWFDNVTIQFQAAGGGALACIGNTNSDWFNWVNTYGITIRTNGGARNNFTSNAGFGLNLNNNTLVFDVSRGTDPSTDLEVPATFWNSGNITKQGNGIVTLSGNSNYSGGITANGGKLVISGSVNSVTSAGVAAGATLEVAGGLLAVAGNVTNNGTLLFTGAAQFSASGTITNNGTIINSSPSLVLPANIINNGSIYQVPAAPAGLSATAGSGQVTLTWAAVSGATGYQVKQATVNGGPYTVVATPTSASQIVTGLSAGTTYDFVVSATNPAGESVDSSQISCAPYSLPLPELTADIGNVGIAGSANYLNGNYTILGAGAGVYASTDAFRYVYQNSAADCSITARVQSLSNTGTSAKTGVMIRESLAGNARCAGVYLTPSSGVQFIWRTSAGSMASVTSSTGKAAPYWVRLTRTGNTFKAFYSANGSSWTQLGTSKTISMAANAYIGTAVTSGTTTALSTGLISNQTVVP